MLMSLDSWQIIEVKNSNELIKLSQTSFGAAKMNAEEVDIDRPRRG